MRWKWIVAWTIVGAVIVTTVIALLVRARRWDKSLLTFQGAVIRRDKDTRRQLPIANVEVTASRGATSIVTHSDASGYYRITFPEVIWPGQTVILSFRHDDYWPLDINVPIQFRSVAKRDYVAAMEPMPSLTPVSTEQPNRPQLTVSNISVRYTINFQSDENIGSAVRMFQVANQGNVPCRHQAPCSPDGNWKASTGSVTMDAGQGNEFRNVRASCIAGPCPFTRVEPGGFKNGGRTVTVSAVNWSDTTTFLVEAEVFHTAIGSSVRHSYPVIFGRTLNFTLPATQEGVSIEAEVNGAPMVFPLGPELYLSWATCSRGTNKEGEQESIVYRCELKSGYKF
jgi:hypothetical protein